MSKRWWIGGFFFGLLMSLYGWLWHAHRKTAPLPAPIVLQPVGFSALPGWQSSHLKASWQAFHQSCQHFVQIPANQPVGSPAVPVVAGDIQAACSAAMRYPSPNDAAIRQFFEQHFQAYSVRDPHQSAQGKFTGYYVPELSGRLNRQPGFTVPVYGVPRDLIQVDLGLFDPKWQGQTIVGKVAGHRLRPYDVTRAKVNQGQLQGKAPVVMWLKDRVARFFLQVQGSGFAQLPGHRRVLLSYAAWNGQPYYSIGQHLLEQHLITPMQASLRGIKDWLHQHPVKAKAVMAHNVSFVFFDRHTAAEPEGALHVPLTPGVSLAVDASLLPLGLPLWLDTQIVPPGQSQRQPMHRLMIAQDVGSAIKGAVRGDVYWGNGKRAGQQAGSMVQFGRYWLFLPKRQRQ